MKIIQLWVKYIAASIAVIVLPLIVMAHDAVSAPPENCRPMSHAGIPMGMPPFAMFPEAPPLGMMPPFMRSLKLTSDQQDKIFALVHEQIPEVREKLKAASKAMEELHRMAGDDHFNADKARMLAETNAQAMAQVILMHTELDAKLRMLLTPEQRKQFDDARSKMEACGSFKR